MTTTIRLFALLPALLAAAPAAAMAQDGGLDRTINETVAPVTAAVSNIVLFTLPVLGQDVPAVVILLVAGAIFFTFYMRFVNIRAFGLAFRVVSGKYTSPDDPGEVTHFQALTAALSGTVGLGNIAGVALAVTAGGPGATFWMILAGLFSMTTKCVECTLGVHYREIDENGEVSGGPMYYLSKGFRERGLPTLGKILGAASAIMVIAGTLGSGALFQTNQAVSQILNVAVPLTGGAESPLAGSGWIFGLIIAGLAGIVVIGGIKKIVHVTEFLVPVMAAIYIGTALIILIANAGAIPEAFGLIISGAFTPAGVGGGILGVLIIGMQRAAFSNEAGLGSAPIAHSAAKTKEPVAEGLVALLEPFFDTVVVCTVTSLVIIITGLYTDATANDGIRLTSDAFASVFSWFPYLLAIAVVLFAFSTSITWFYYGQRSFFYLFGHSRPVDVGYKTVFLSAIVLGSAMQLSAVMNFADAVILSMAFPNMVGLFVMAPMVRRMLQSYLARVKSGEIHEQVLSEGML